MPGRSVQFAVVREDAEIDLAVLRRTRARRALLVASGGCTAFEFLSRSDATAVTAIDPNPAQLDLIERKLDALGSPPGATRAARFNVGDDDPEGLCQCGNFEALFRQLRSFLGEFVAPATEWTAFFTAPDPDAGAPERWIASPYWRVAFELFFSDPILETMFTPAATQHAAPGSYPLCFRRAFERGLRRADARTNPFLHHVLLGHYLPSSPPPYLARPVRRPDLTLVESSLEALEDFSAYDFVGLSNVMDWMDAPAIERLAAAVGDTLSPGAAVVWRQLNHGDDLTARFGPRLRFDSGSAATHLGADRSLFYDRLLIGFATDERPAARRGGS